MSTSVQSACQSSRILFMVPVAIPSVQCALKIGSVSPWMLIPVPSTRRPFIKRIWHKSACPLEIYWLVSGSSVTLNLLDVHMSVRSVEMHVIITTILTIMIPILIQMAVLPDHVKICPFNPNGEMVCKEFTLVSIQMSCDDQLKSYSFLHLTQGLWIGMWPDIFA